MDTVDDDRRSRSGVRLGFGLYVLDMDRGCLLLRGSEIALRPKTYAVLKFLVENAGRLVSKEDLFAAAWPKVVVTDDALVQSIGELRRALGDNGPDLIKTIPRRGYRFEATVEDISQSNEIDKESDAPSGAEAAHVPPADPTSETGDVAVLDADSAEYQRLEIRLRPWQERVAARLRDVPSKLGLLKEPNRSQVWRAGIATALSVLLVFGVASLIGNFVNGRVGDNGPGIAEPASRPALAVLPFEDQSDDPTRGYLTDGLTQDIIGAMGRFSGLTVISWNAVAPYRGKFAVPAQIAQDLGVRYQVEGTVQRTAERVRVAARLVGSTGQVLWSSRFEEELTGLFALQDKITTQIAGALAVHVTQSEQRRAFTKPTASLEAYDYVLRARPALQRPDRGSIVETRTLLKRAIQLDPTFASAYAALAQTYHIDVSWGWAQSPTAVLGRSEALVSKALQLRDDGVLAHVVLGRIHLFHQQFEQAKAEMERAVEINPSDADGLAGRGNIQMWLGQTDAAIVSLEMAQRIDPALNVIDRFALSMAYYLKGRYGEAGRQAEINLRNSASSSFSYVVLAAALAQQGRSDDAARVVATLRVIDPVFDPNDFGSKFRSPADRASLRDGLRKAGWEVDTGQAPLVK